MDEDVSLQSGNVGVWGEGGFCKKKCEWFSAGCKSSCHEPRTYCNAVIQMETCTSDMYRYWSWLFRDKDVKGVTVERYNTSLKQPQSGILVHMYAHRIEIPPHLFPQQRQEHEKFLHNSLSCLSYYTM